MRAIKKSFKRPRWLAALLCMCVILPYLNGFTLSAPDQPAEGQEGLCKHHPAHTEECGYAPAAPAQPCSHQHDAGCGYVPAQPEVPCNRNCGQEKLAEEDGPESAQPDQTPAEGGAEGDLTAPEGEEAKTPEAQPEQNPEAKADQNQQQELPQEQTPLDEAPTIHDPNCAYRPAQPEQPCNHQHDASCGYAPARPASPCGFLCEKCREDYVQSWEYIDEEEVLVFAQDANLWGLRTYPEINDGRVRFYAKQ